MTQLRTIQDRFHRHPLHRPIALNSNLHHTHEVNSTTIVAEFLLL